jgi:aldose sugar dehydrogenase
VYKKQEDTHRITIKKIQKSEALSSNNQTRNFIFIFLSAISVSYLISLSFDSEYTLVGQTENETLSGPQIQVVPEPSLTDLGLRLEKVADGFDFPTSMEFVGDNDIVLLEKNSGNVLEVLNGNVTHQLLHIDVSTKDERGLLGIAITKNGNKSSQDDTSIYLYYTRCVEDKASDTQSCGNYVYRYELNRQNNTLTNPKLIATLPGLPGPSHNGGKLLMDKDGNLFVTIGDLQSTKFNQNQTGYDTKAQNILNGTSADGRAGILRITQDGKSVGPGILGDEYPLNVYYAYGIKNSFGIAIDPLNRNVWDTENGPQFGDEINLVKPGFNSGWEKVQGIWKLNQTREKEDIFDESDNDIGFVDFSGKGEYSSPEFVWDKPVTPTALTFLHSDKLGVDYEDDIFVGSAKKGIIFHFDLTSNRESLDLHDDLADKMYSKKEDNQDIIFGENFGIITDLKVGPDGYLYVLTGSKGEGTLYRIVSDL